MSMESVKKRVIVIGAGLGGISAAISLVAEGFEVEIFEKNNKVGGKLNVLEREGFSFDLGPSIFTLPHFFRNLFDMHGRNMDDYFSLVPVKPHWRNFFEDGTVIDLYKDGQEMADELAKLSDDADPEALKAKVKESEPQVEEEVQTEEEEGTEGETKHGV